MSATASRLLAVFFVFSLATTTVARELAVDVDDMVEVEIATVAVAVTGAPVVLLREPRAREVIPITIGPNEAQAILRAMDEIRTPRPMTHDLFAPVLDALNGKLEKIYVDDLVANTYLGALQIRVEGRDEPVLVDSRPSDAMALALRAGASIHVAPRVLEAAEDIHYHGLEDEVVTAMGITVSEVTPDLREALQIPEDRQGLLVTGVSGSAEAQGVEAGALLLSINDEKPESPMAFLEMVQATPEDEKAQLVLWQDGEKLELALDPTIAEPGPTESFIEPESGISL